MAGHSLGHSSRRTAQMGIVLLLPLVIATVCVGSVGSACPPNGVFWDNCNICFCKADLVACSNKNCPDQTQPREVPLAAQAPQAPGEVGVGLAEEGWRLPNRPGIVAYKPGRNRLRNEAVAQGWGCHWGSQWLESGGCTKCVCGWGGKINCDDSGLCVDGQLILSNEVPARRRRNAPEGAEGEGEGEGAATESAAEAEGVTAASVVETSTPPQPEPKAQPQAQPQALVGQEAGASPPAGTEEEPASSSDAQTVSAAAAAAAAPAEGAPAEGAAGAGNATQSPPVATTAQATVVKERSCKSGSTWEEECNSCWCLDNGMAACTTQRCDPHPAVPLAAPVAPAAPATLTPAAQAAAPDAPAAQVAVSGPAAQAAPAVNTAESTAAPTTAPAAATAAPTGSGGNRRKRRFVIVAT